MTKQDSPVPSRAHAIRRAAGAIALLALGGTSLFALRTCSGADEPEPRDARQALSPAAQSVEIPSFRRPEEAKRYFQAMTDGDQRALIVLDRALREARNQPSPNAEVITALEQQKRARVARLKRTKSSHQNEVAQKRAAQATMARPRNL